MSFSVFQKKIGFWGILGPPYCGICATIRIGREVLCLPYEGFFQYALLNVRDSPQIVKCKKNSVIVLAKMFPSNPKCFPSVLVGFRDSECTRALGR